MLKKLPIRLIRILTVVFTSFLCLLIVGNEVAGAYAPTINHALNIKSFKVVNSDDDTDTIYFKSEYSENKVDESGNPVYTQDGVDRLKKDADDACAEIEGEGLVLMKNDGALPLPAGSKVSLFGQGSVIFNYGSSGSSATNTEGYTDFRAAIESEGLAVNADLWNFYSSGAGKDYVRNSSNVNEAPWSLVNTNNSGSFASFGDAAIVVISRNSGEGADVPTTGSDGLDGNYLALSQNERDMLVGLTSLKNGNVFKKIVVILNSSSPIQLDFLSADGISVDACMWVGNVGRTGIYAVAKAVSGKIVPSGSLSDTYVYDNFSSPAMASWMLTGNKRFAQKYSNYSDFKVDGLSLNGTQYHYGVYVEGVYVGYRYYETRYEDVVLQAKNAGDYDYGKVVAYPFGHGLSYASFKYDDFSVVEKEDDFEVSVKVTNVSEDYDGKEVVQIYVQKPYDKASGVETPSVELVGYAKTGVLTKNGGSETVKISVKKEQLTSYDVNANDGRGGYVLSKGDFYLAVGKDAHDALNNVLSAKALSGAAVDETKMTAAGNGEFTFKWTKSARDEVSFAASKETNNLITNQLDFADINRYNNRGDNGVTYVSRGNWTGTWPKQAVILTLDQSMADDLGIHKELPTETDEAMPTYGADNGMSLIMLRSTEDNIIDYNSAAWESFLDQMTFEQQSLLLTNAAFGTVPLEAPFNKPATKDNDGPTGVVRSATGISFPSEGIWASSFNTELIEKVGGLLAEDALYNGYQCLYATGMNIHRTPYGGRSHEYFSEDPFLTGYSVMYEVKGMQDKGVIPTLKHYAFNDEEDQRGGIGIWLNEQEAREIMLKPFEMAMRPSMGSAHGLMTSFNRAGCIWTSASSELMINIARKEWGFDGYSITDMAESFKYYMTYDDGIMNGTDTYLAADDEYALSDYAYSIPFRLRMREACHRVLYTIANYSAAMNGLSAASKIIPLTPWWQSTVYAGIGVFGGLCAVGAGLWITYYVLAIIKKKK